MSGVAATLLLGETPHSALGLHQNEIRPEQVTVWEETRLEIIDEISFASKYEVQKIHKNLCLLADEINKKFGGFDLIFSGDFRQMEPCMTSHNLRFHQTFSMLLTTTETAILSTQVYLIITAEEQAETMLF
jgi:hypothetical protein